jgi:4-carboxymuconolactone decarboxylase
VTDQRIAQLPPEDWSPEAAELLGRPVPGRPADAPVSTFLATMAHHPALLRRWASYSVSLTRKARIPERERELAILRTGWLCQGAYEWGHHVHSARAAGVTAEEIEQVIAGPDHPAWDPFDAAIVRSVDELRTEGCISDATWATLAERWDEQQLLELPLLVGHYHAVAWVQNSIKVALDPGIGGLEER